MSFNRSLEEARGSYCVVLCADDALTPGSLERAVDAMTEHPSASFVYGRVYDFREKSKIDTSIYDLARQPPILYRGRRWIDLRCAAGRTPLRAPEAMMRTATLRATGQYEGALPADVRPEHVAASRHAR